MLFANEIVEEPFISCSADAIYAKWKTNTTFVGHVNVRHAPNRFCYQVLVTNNQIELLIPHQDCQVSRIRSLRPAGVIIATSVLISFHPEYVTAGDRIYLLQCLHTRAPDQSLLPGSVAPTTTFTEVSRASLSAPQCEYRVRNPKNGQLVDDVIIGEIVRHQWSCTIRPDHHLCLVITNCFLITSDSKHQLIDEQGCSMDRAVLPELVYVDNLNVEQNVSVFGIAQKPFVYFQCQLSLLPPTADGCPQPECSGSQRKRRDLHSAMESDEAQIFDAVTQPLEILELDRRHRKRDCRRQYPGEVIVNEFGHDEIVCVTRHSFTVIVFSTILIVACTIVAAAALLLRSVRCRGGRM